jgi:hypothetical protein
MSIVIVEILILVAPFSQYTILDPLGTQRS